MERRRFANTDLSVSIIGLGCYGMSGAYGPADDAESSATIHRALDLGVNFLDTSASYGQGHNHRLISEAIRGRRHDVVIHSKSGSPRDGSPDAVRGGGDPRYLRQTCEQSLKNLSIEALDVFCMSRVDPNVPVEESVGAMAELVKEGKTRFISLSGRTPRWPRSPSRGRWPRARVREPSSCRYLARNRASTWRRMCAPQRLC